MIRFIVDLCRSILMENPLMEMFPGRNAHHSANLPIAVSSRKIVENEVGRNFYDIRFALVLGVASQLCTRPTNFSRHFRLVYVRI